MEFIPTVANEIDTSFAMAIMLGVINYTSKGFYARTVRDPTGAPVSLL